LTGGASPATVTLALVDPRPSAGRVDAPCGFLEASMVLGPLEYTVIGFEGNNFNGSIADEISRVVESGTIALVDLVFIGKDEVGECTVLELDNKEDPRFAGFAPMLEGMNGLLTEEDIQAIGVGLDPNTSALVIMFEHRWAVRIKDAITTAGGYLVTRETISPESMEMLNAEIEAEALSA
jgi:hypothetical protein